MNDLIAEIKSLTQLEVKNREETKRRIQLDCFKTSRAHNGTGAQEKWPGAICVRIEDVPVESKEIGEKVYEKVCDLLKVACLDVLVSSIDGAHCIGTEYRSCKNIKTCCIIIVCFMSYRHQALFYRERENLKDVQIELDLTKRLYGILEDVIDLHASFL